VGVLRETVMLYRPYAVVTELVGQNDLLDAIAYDLSFVLGRDVGHLRL